MLPRVDHALGLGGVGGVTGAESPAAAGPAGRAAKALPARRPHPVPESPRDAVRPVSPPAAGRPTNAREARMAL
jgi:hypothetical protein